MRQMITMFLLAAATLMVSIPVMLILPAPDWVRLMVCAVGMLFGMIAGALAWGAALADGERRM